MHAPTKPTFTTHPLFTTHSLTTTQPAASPAPAGEVARASVTEGALLPWASGGGAEQREAEGASFASPALAGEVSAKPTEGVPPDGQSPMADPSFFPTLLEDLLNPSITTAELCQIHHCTLEHLSATINSPAFARARTHHTSINTTRRALLEDESQTLAITRLTDLLRDRPDTPAHAETQRKAATTILRPHAPSPATAGEMPAQQAEGDSFASPALAGEVSAKPTEGGFLSSPVPTGEVSRASVTEGALRPASPLPTPANPTPSQPVPTNSGTTDSSNFEGVSDMNTKAAASIFAVAMGSGIIAGAWYFTSPGSDTPAPTAPPPTPERTKAGNDLFSLPAEPSAAKVFFESANGDPIPPSSRSDVRGMIGMMASLIDRMHEFDVNGDGMLDDLEKLAMGMKLRKEFLAEHDLDGDGDMSRDEWRAFQQSMFEMSATGQAMMAQFDLDGDGVLSEEEQAAFDEHMRKQEEQRQAEDRARMDTNNDGEISDDERRNARRKERDFWRNQVRTAESSFDYDGDGELNIQETNDAWEAWVEYQEVDDFITRFDRDGDRSMGPADYDAFLTAYDRNSLDADVNGDGKVSVSDINAFRDLVIRSRGVN